MPLCDCFGGPGPTEKPADHKKAAIPAREDLKEEPANKPAAETMGNDNSKPEGGLEDMHNDPMGQMKTQVGRIKAIVGGKTRENERKAVPVGQPTNVADYEFILVRAEITEGGGGRCIGYTHRPPIADHLLSGFFIDSLQLCMHALRELCPC
jgi:hypothetical protein